MARGVEIEMTAGVDRQEILRRFDALLDSALSAEVPPAGIDAQVLDSVLQGSQPADLQDPKQTVDSYTLWAAMTVLTQEIKLQGRAFQDLNRTIAGQTDKLADELAALRAERERTLQRETERRCRKEALNVLIDLRDRLVRGQESASAVHVHRTANRARWWSRVFKNAPPDPAPDSISALAKGYELGIARLDQTLSEFNAHEIQCRGDLFDPRRMNAIDTEESTKVPAGTVLEIYRSGFEWNGETFRPAQVKVSRAPAGSQEQHE